MSTVSQNDPVDTLLNNETTYTRLEILEAHNGVFLLGPLNINFFIIPEPQIFSLILNSLAVTISVCLTFFILRNTGLKFGQIIRKSVQYSKAHPNFNLFLTSVDLCGLLKHTFSDVSMIKRPL